ncbi:MAG TPA: GNAT family N-acetyltransferase [Thermoplasmata archaeon]|nr:GNAT family N-acetyltransferase [Thermoplasmata archaeon]
MPNPPSAELIDLVGEDRERAVPVIVDSFEGIYRWHAKRTLREAGEVRAAVLGGEVAGVSMLERFVPEVGYVYYLAVAARHRRHGLGRLLLDDALSRFDRLGVEVVYAAAEEDNVASLELFRSRGFRTVERKELGYKEGGLGAWGLRSRMRVVWGEVLLGKRLRPTSGGATAPP